MWLRRYVYQKAYVEFFCSPESFRALEARLASAPSVTYMAVNAAGQNASNVPAGAVRGSALKLFLGFRAYLMCVATAPSIITWP